jgi:fructokinase
LLIDFIPFDEVGATVGFRMHAGGSPYNVAIGLGRLGASVAFASKASTDFFGRYLTRNLRANGVDTRFVVADPAFSTLAFVAYENGEPSYSFYGDGMADTLLRPSDLPRALFDEARIAHIGSISLLRGETPTTIVAAAERLRGTALLSIDPNIRPGLVRDRAGYEALLARCFALADVIKISAADLAWLRPGVPLLDAAVWLRGFGAELVVITRGAEGALALRGAREWTAPVFPVNVVDTVGAGDAFSAGLLSELARLDVVTRTQLAALPDETLNAALRFASATAALTCAQAGANPPGRDAVNALLSA